MRLQLTFCLLVCENFFSEVKAAVGQQGFVGVEVRPFPSRCCSTPVRWSELAESVKGSEADVVVVLGSYCLREMELPLGELRQWHIHQQEQCHYLLVNPTLVDAVQENGTYLLSPGWLKRWKKHVKLWGFDQETALDFFGESLKKLLLLDTGTDQEVQQHLTEFGDFLQLPTDTLPIGLEFLGLVLARVVSEHQQQELVRQKKEIERQAADSAMALDLIPMVTREKSRSEVVASIIELFIMLFDPKKIRFIPVGKTSGVHFEQTSDLTTEEEEQVKQFYANEGKNFLLDEEQGSFLLRIGRKDQVRALLLISQVAYPKYVHQYANTALALSEVCALAIEHVQALQKLVRASHLAGKAQVATEVLHNVGNTLNSISVSSEQVRELVQQSSSASLPSIVQLIQDNEGDLGAFCSHDPRGKRLPSYFARLSGKMIEERELLLSETTRQLQHIRRVAQIIRAQQDTAKGTNFTQQINLTSLLEESLEFFQEEMEKQQITVVRHYNFQQSITGEPHKILQVVNNLIRNAVDAFDGILIEQKKIFLSTYSAADHHEVIVEISDNGKGMQESILQQAFTFGFTTKASGHGFGLHNAANLTKEMGGRLTGESAGLEQGAKFMMRLPVIATGRTA